MRETSRGGAVVSAVVAVLERQQNEATVKKTEVQKTRTTSAFKEGELFIKTSKVPAENNGFKCTEQNNGNRAKEPPLTETIQGINKRMSLENETDFNEKEINDNDRAHKSKTAVVIREFHYKEGILNNPYQETSKSSPTHQNLDKCVKQKDPKLAKNTSYVIVKDTELLNYYNKSDTDTDSGFRKCSPSNCSNATSKNSSIQYTQTIHESSRQFSSIQARANILKTLRNVETLAEENNLQTADRNFETAIKNFDRTAEDVQNYVLKNIGSETLSTEKKITGDGEECVIFRNEQFDGEKKERFSSGTDYTWNVSDEFDSSSDESTSDSEQGDEHIIRDGLETITEEDRITGSSFKSTEGELSNCCFFPFGADKSGTNLKKEILIFIYLILLSILQLN